LLIVTWDEDDSTASNHIATIFVGPMVKPGQYTRRIDHFNVLRTLEDLFGLPALGASASATPITEIWQPVTQGPDFSLSVSPSSLTVSRGGTASSTLTVASLNGF